MVKLTDEKFKDSSPIETVSTIKQLLKENGLEVEEDWYPNTVSNCYSLRLFLAGTRLYSCGKGVTKELANASAHAELMERISGGKLGCGKLRVTDSVMMGHTDLGENCRDFFESMAKVVTLFENKAFTAEDILNACFDYEGESTVSEAIPFYSVLDDKMVYLPGKILPYLFSANGNCAGNTAEEAIVQGFSEIVERWNQRHFMCMDLVPPTIPDSYLQNYPNAYQTIADIKSAGYDVIIKDCSMGSGYPVIATAVIDKDKHAYHVHLGASPVFEVALNRSLTETFQGRLLESVADTDLSESAKTSGSAYRKSFVYGRGSYPISFFTEESSFPFVPFPDRTNCTNLQLLQYVMEYARERNVKFFIRDYSILGFHAYKIVVPDMCDASFDFLSNHLGVPKMVGFAEKSMLNLKDATADQLFALQLLNLYKLNNTIIDKDPRFSKFIFPITKMLNYDRALAYIHLGYIDWECDNKKSAFNYMKSIQSQRVPGISDYFSCLLRAHAMLKTEMPLSHVLSNLSIFYKEDTIHEVQQTIQSGKNPFEDYVVCCKGPKLECSDCRYRDICQLHQHFELFEILNQRTSTFDNQLAFHKLKELFASIS